MMCQAQPTAVHPSLIASAELWLGPNDPHAPHVGRFAAERLWNTHEAAVVTTPLEMGGALQAVLGIPWFAGNHRQSCLLLASTTAAGTLEVWHPDVERNELRLSSGYFGKWDEFRRITALTKFSLGAGLPGRVWAAQAPVLLEDLSESKAFLRAEAAMSIGLDFGLGLPVQYASSLGVVTFLSSRHRPLGRSVDLWRLTAEGDLEHMQGLSFVTSAHENGLALSHAQQLALRAARSFCPEILQPSEQSSGSPVTCGFAWPSRDAAGTVHVATVVG